MILYQFFTCFSLFTAIILIYGTVCGCIGNVLVGGHIISDNADIDGFDQLRTALIIVAICVLISFFLIIFIESFCFWTFLYLSLFDLILCFYLSKVSKSYRNKFRNNDIDVVLVQNNLSKS